MADDNPRSTDMSYLQNCPEHAKYRDECVACVRLTLCRRAEKAEKRTAVLVEALADIATCGGRTCSNDCVRWEARKALSASMEPDLVQALAAAGGGGPTCTECGGS